MGITIGYILASTSDQDLETDKVEILKLANEKGLGHVAWVVEKAGCTQDWRERKLGKVLLEMKEGDALVVSELSRLGRSTLQILEIMKSAKEKGVSVYAVKGGWNLNSNMESKIVLSVLAMVAEIERDLISARTRVALRARKAAGIKLGRPKGPGKSKLDTYREEIISLLQVGSRQNYIAGRYGVTPASLSNWLKRHNISKESLKDAATPETLEMDAPPYPKRDL